ncbi:MAG: 16S rRNA (cytosine(967)-C(5))-methyltransferase RsmB [Gammaproteobacteria bacterium]
MLREVIDDRRSLNDVLAPATATLPEPERRLAGELTYGVLRWWFQLDACLAWLLEKPLRARDRDLHMLLAAGAYQILHLSIPPHVAVSQTAEAARHLGKAWAVGLINGVLRRLQRERDSLQERFAGDEVIATAHPRWLLARLQAAWPGEWRKIAQAGNRRAPMTLRVNRLRQDRETYLQRLSAAGISAQPLKFSPDGIELERAVGVEALPDFALGAVSVQDGAAQLAADLMELEPGMVVLDACAAPGGKSCHLLEREPGLEKLVAVDVDARRLAVLEENLLRLGLGAETIVGDAAHPERWWRGGGVERILLDAPCSGTGVIRRHPDIKVLRRDADIESLAARQRSLLDGLWSILKPGGMLVYATCSVLPEENERQIAAFLARQGDAQERPIVAEWGRACGVGRQILTGEENMDGFYYARLVKRSAGN